MSKLTIYTICKSSVKGYGYRNVVTAGVRSFIFIGMIIFATSCNKKSQISLPAIISNNMVLQQNELVTIWGWASPGSMVSIENNWDHRIIKGRADKNGRFEIVLKTPSAGGPYTIRVASENEIQIQNIMVGEVWLCSGQSNMEIPMRGYSAADTIEGALNAIENSDNDHIRIFQVPRNLGFKLADISQGEWKRAEPSSIAWTSAVAYFYAKELYDSLALPVGIISCSYGGTPIESWLPGKVVNGKELYEVQLEKKQHEEEIAALSKEDIYRSFVGWLESSRSLSLETGKKHAITQPTDIDQTDLAGYLGELIFRKNISINNIVANDSLTLSLGEINDIGQVFFNDSLVWEQLLPSRSGSKCRINLPSGFVNKGNNYITVYLDNILWGGGLKGPFEDMYCCFSSEKDKKYSLSGEWQVEESFSISEQNPVPAEGIPHFQLISSVYNGMLYQVIPYGIKGILWYQGESNVGTGYSYESMLTDLIRSWRDSWRKTLPFYYVQIAPFDYQDDSIEQSPLIREAQRRVQKLNGVGMVVSLDLGMNKNIHPPFKKEISHRLALQALKGTYNYDHIIASGPIYHGITQEGREIRVHFSNEGSKLLMKNDTEQSGFEICGPDSHFLPAKAVIDGEDILLSNELIEKAIAARYAWSDTARAILYNSEDLPASPFTSEGNPL